MTSRSRRAGCALAIACLAVTSVGACTSTGSDDGGGSRQLVPTGSPRTAPAPTLSVPPRTPTGWGPTAGELARAQAATARMTNRELAGRLFVAAYRGVGAPVALVRRFHLGGVIAMSGNIASVDQIAAANALLQRSARGPWPLVIGVDQEGGTVERIGAPMTQFPTYMSLGAAGSPALASRVARASGQELRAAGFTLVYAPDADVTIGPADPTIGSRSAGDRPHLVARIVAASVRGYRQSGIVAVAKHFPGHGSVSTDSHRALPHQSATVARLERRDWVPFKAAVRESVPAVMVAHVALDRVDEDVPADLSRPDVDLLRDKLGFDGLVTTDALNMAAIPSRYSAARVAVAALRAGVDQLLMPAGLRAAYRGVVRALHAGRLDRSGLELSVARAGALMLHEAARRAPSRSVVGSHAALSRAESAAAVTLVAGACRGPYVGTSVRPVGDPSLVDGFSAAARTAGLHVVRATKGPAARRASVVALLVDTTPRRPPDVAVATTRPSVLAGVAAPTRIALFGGTTEAMAVLVDVLVGRAEPQGRLPVTVLGIGPRPCG